MIIHAYNMVTDISVNSANACESYLFSEITFLGLLLLEPHSGSHLVTSFLGDLAWIFILKQTQNT